MYSVVYCRFVDGVSSDGSVQLIRSTCCLLSGSFLHGILPRSLRLSVTDRLLFEILFSSGTIFLQNVTTVGHSSRACSIVSVSPQRRQSGESYTVILFKERAVGRTRCAIFQFRSPCLLVTSGEYKVRHCLAFKTGVAWSTCFQRCTAGTGGL